MDKWQRAESLAKGTICIATLFLEAIQVTTDIDAQHRGLRHIHINIGTQVKLLVISGVIEDQTLILL